MTSNEPVDDIHDLNDLENRMQKLMQEAEIHLQNHVLEKQKRKETSSNSKSTPRREKSKLNRDERRKAKFEALAIKKFEYEIKKLENQSELNEEENSIDQEKVLENSDFSYLDDSFNSENSKLMYKDWLAQGSKFESTVKEKSKVHKGRSLFNNKNIYTPERRSRSTPNFSPSTSFETHNFSPSRSFEMEVNFLAAQEATRKRLEAKLNFELTKNRNVI